MPMSKPEDFALKDEASEVCCFCSNEDGSVKSCNEIFEGGVNYFMSVLKGYDKSFVEKIVRYNMNTNCPHRKGKDDAILKWEMASPEEFEEVMKRLEESVS
jgi:hypothetical protein